MNKLLISLLFTIPGFCIHSWSQITLDGKYTGKNLYVQNPTTVTGVGYCTDSVYVNGEKYHGKIIAPAFEINLDSLNLAIQDDVIIQIYHKNHCKPKVLNTECLPIHREITFESLQTKDDNTIHWKVAPPQKARLCSFILQQYRWNRWDVIGIQEVDSSKTGYSDSLGHLHAGTNRFRIVYQNENKHREYSNEIVIDINRKPLKYYQDRKKQRIYFNQPTDYELYDAYGTLLFKGYGTEISTDGYNRGVYYLNFDNQNTKILVKGPKKQGK